jgi:hypothetical protein
MAKVLKPTTFPRELSPLRVTIEAHFFGLNHVAI